MKPLRIIEGMGCSSPRRKGTDKTHPVQHQADSYEAVLRVKRRQSFRPIGRHCRRQKIGIRKQRRVGGADLLLKECGRICRRQRR